MERDGERSKMKRNILAVIGLISVVLAVFVFTANDENNMTQVNEATNMKELVHDYSVGKIEGQTASITSHQLIVTESDGNQFIYDLPEDDFFVSIAPYIDKTHP